MLIFGASANCIPWVYVPEILPLHARAKGTAIGISSNWFWVSSRVSHKAYEYANSSQELRRGYDITSNACERKLIA